MLNTGRWRFPKVIQWTCVVGSTAFVAPACAVHGCDVTTFLSSTTTAVATTWLHHVLPAHIARVPFLVSILPYVPALLPAVRGVTRCKASSLCTALVLYRGFFGYAFASAVCIIFPHRLHLFTALATYTWDDKPHDFPFWTG